MVNFPLTEARHAEIIKALAEQGAKSEDETARRVSKPASALPASS
jgi:hypothetical protein